MFKKLKEKITEEVKISPQRFAEFTQSVSEKLQNSTGTDDNFFSIGEDDVNSSMSINNHGFSTVPLVSPSQDNPHRRNSNTSIASDISFLPRYDASNMYHLQSDLDISASEMEDNVSTASSQLGHLTKEQIHSAFQKSQMRYHKYRGRFTDLAKHYTDLERENAKIKAILVETQDKAIRRVQELKEQCNLEQKAKAHLESALRDEIDERNYKIKSLETKITLLTAENNSRPLINIDSENDNQTEIMKNFNDARKEIETLNEKLQEMKANAIIFQTKEQEYKTKIAAYEKEIVAIAEREKGNNLKLAQSKMELHNEILTKDTEISNLKSDNETLKQNLNSLDYGRKNNENMKIENLKSQNKKLIEKIELLTQKSNNMEKEVLKIESYKIEIENLKQEIVELKNIETNLLTEKESITNNLTQSEEKFCDLLDRYKKLEEITTKERKVLENQITNLREEAKKGLLSLEPKIREKLQDQFSKREIDLKKEFENRVEELSDDNVDIKEIKLQLLLKDDLIKNMSEELESLKCELCKKSDAYISLETNHLDLIEDCTKLRNIISNLEKEKMSLDSWEEKVPRLEAHIKTLQEELEAFQQLVKKKDDENNELNSKIVELQNFNKKNHDNDSNTMKELNQLKELLKKSVEENDILKEKLKCEVQNTAKLNETRINLDKEVDQLKERLRVSKEESETFRVLKLDLEKLQEEKETFLNDIKQNLLLTTEVISSPNITGLNQIFTDFKKLIEVKENEISVLTSKNAELLQDLDNETEKYRLFEKKFENFEVETTQAKTIQLTKLQEEKSNVDKLVSKLQEKIHILEEKNQAIEIDIGECQILQMKLQELEDENKNLLNSFEIERVNFSKVQDSLTEKDNVIEKFTEDNLELKNEISRYKEEISNLNIILDQKIKQFDFNDKMVPVKDSNANNMKTADKINNILEINVRLIKELSEKDAKIMELAESVTRLSETLEKQSVENKTLQECIDNLHSSSRKNQIEMTESAKTQNLYFTKKIEELNHEISLKNNEVCQLNEKLCNVEEMCTQHLCGIETKKQEVLCLQNQICSLEDKERNYINEISNLKGAFKEKDDILERFSDIKSDLNEKLDYINSITEDNQKLIEENAKLLQDVADKDNILKKFNEMKFDLNEKLSHINSITEDNRKLVEENVKLLEDCSDKDEILKRFSEIKSDLIEKLDHINTITEDNHKLVEENVKLLQDVADKDDILKRFNEIKLDLNDKLDHINSLTEDNHKLFEENSKLLQDAAEKIKLENEISELKTRLDQITSDYQNMLHENQILTNSKEELETKFQEIENLRSIEHPQNTINQEKVLKEKIEELNSKLGDIQKQNLELTTQIKEMNSTESDIVIIQRDFYEIKEKCDTLFIENKNLTQEYAKLEEKCNEFSKMKEKMQNQINELEKHCIEILHEKQLLQDEIQELKISPLNFQNNSSKLNDLAILKQEQLLSTSENDTQACREEIEILRQKITKYKSLELTNKTSIEFYENELQKVKNQNDKLNRKLDETLVTLQHCAELSSSTEVEYLKNVLYNYMLGKESLVLARVIAAVCKFDPHQTDLILQREQQKQTLLGQFGFI